MMVLMSNVKRKNIELVVKVSVEVDVNVSIEVKRQR